jgi:serine/threonine protein kinase/tetratricopeptide (TPR) repeat protein
MIATNRHLLSILGDALDCGSPQKRAAYLDRACHGDSELRARVEALLKAHEEAGSFLNGNPNSNSLPTGDEPITERPGTIIGPYKLLEQIGEGGFGVVFMAEQTRPVSRKVALKVVKPGMDTRQVVARFEAERQALALMDHPNIAHVFDGGETGSGRPYFVMELVRGIPLTEFCDQNQLPVRQRLELLVSVCQAVQHAHQKGIIHRDLKPSNVLVTLHDGRPVVKVIDFGIAKAAGQRLTEKTLFTNFAQMIGTPLYMSPEQTALSGLDVDTRSDIYSLGVLLYELMTGTTPFDKERLKTVSYDELRRILREEEPPKPSTRINTLGQAASTLSSQRRSDPKRLSRMFRGELDWIVMKCLEKDRNRRYETCNSLAKDLERYLQDEPVQACPPSMGYRLRKFVRRNRTAVAVAVTAIALLLLAVLGLAITNLRIAEEKAQTKAQRDEAEASFRKSRKAVDEQFTLVSQSKLFDAPGFEALRRDLLESALKYYQEFLEQRPDDPELQAEVAAAQLRLYQVHEAIDGGYSAGAIRQLAKGVDMVERRRDTQPHDAALFTHLAGFAKSERTLYGRYSAAEPQPPEVEIITLLQHTVAIWEEFAQAFPSEAGFQTDLLALYFRLQDVQASVCQPAAALANIRRALAISNELVHRYPKITEYKEQLAKTHEAFMLRLRKSGSSKEVESHFRRAIELRQSLADGEPKVPNNRFELATSQWFYGRWLVEAGRQKDAELAFSQGLAVNQKLVADFPHMPAYRSSLAHMHESLGHLYRDTGETDKAEQAYREALKIWDRLAAAFPTNQNYRVPYSSYCLCALLAASQRQEEADRIFRRFQEFNPETADGRNWLAWSLAARPKFSDPRRALELANAAVQQAPKAGYIWNTLGLVQYRNGNFREAVRTLEKSMELGSGGDSFDRVLLAMAHWRLGNKDEAHKWYSSAVHWEKTNEQHAQDEALCQDLKLFLDEAANMMGIKDQPTSMSKP